MPLSARQPGPHHQQLIELSLLLIAAGTKGNFQRWELVTSCGVLGQRVPWSPSQTSQAITKAIVGFSAA